VEQGRGDAVDVDEAAVGGPADVEALGGGLVERGRRGAGARELEATKREPRPLREQAGDRGGEAVGHAQADPREQALEGRLALVVLAGLEQEHGGAPQPLGALGLAGALAGVDGLA
jgi:hypothetical protein